MDKDLTLTDLRVYGAICMFANTHSSICFPKQQTIADRLGINVPMVSKSVGILVDKGYILKGAKVGVDGRKKQNYYTIKYDIILPENELMPEHNSGVDELMPQDNHELMPQDKSLYNINSFNLLTPLTKKNKTKKEIPVVKESLTTQSDIEKVYCAFLENEKARTDTIQFKRVAPKIKEALKECETIGVLLGRIQTYLEYCTETKGWYSKKDIQSWFNAGFYSAEKQKYYQDGIAKEKAKQPKTEAQKFLINTENRKAVVDTEAVKKQEEVLMEYAKVKTEKPEFMENFKKVLKNYFGGSFASTIDNLKIKSINQNEIVFMLPNQFYADIMQRNKQKFEETCKREIGGFYKKAFTGSVKLVAWKN